MFFPRSMLSFFEKFLHYFQLGRLGKKEAILEKILEQNGVLIFQTAKSDGNLALHTGDHPNRVWRNRKQLALDHIFWLNQTHGSVVTFTHAFHADADAVISFEKEVALAILTADCLPILVFGKKSIAAIHAGWRGLAANIVEKTVFKMQERPEYLTVWLGPAIASCCFEVGQDVKKAFLPFHAAFSTLGNEKFSADLKKIAQMQLQILGVCPKQIVDFSVCTKCDARFFSHRRNKTKGRMASLIYRKSF